MYSVPGISGGIKLYNRDYKGALASAIGAAVGGGTATGTKIAAELGGFASKFTGVKAELSGAVMGIGTEAAVCGIR